MSLWSMLFGKKPVEDPSTSRPLTSREVAMGKRPPPARSGDPPRIRWRSGSFPLKAVGESYYADALEKICGRYTRYGTDLEVDAVLQREPDNPHDANAVAVLIDGLKVGHLPRDQAARVGYQMRSIGLTSARCAARIRGGWRTNQYDEGGYGVSLAVPEWGEIDFTVGVGKKPPSAPRKPSDRPEAAPGGVLDGYSVAIHGEPSNGPVAHELAALGASIAAGPGKTTSFLVVVADRPFPEGLTRSRTYRKAEELVAAGAPIRIWSIGEMRRFVKDFTPD
ncbi:HIRAN domain-containing protein [Cereibacter johrii]|uniref:HIRAN domain-containing protein n=1 Tax=Cereibacter johrii TaxID=445629 RepID=UPI000DCDA58A|nr:HIRAN domain-containing protein [Cereibacter johrii]RAZ83415.1 hypothetical protein DDV93_13975 [Cereibacter johrii]